jgi:hypothetical protein
MAAVPSKTVTKAAASGTVLDTSMARSFKAMVVPALRMRARSTIHVFSRLSSTTTVWFVVWLSVVCQSVEELASSRLVALVFVPSLVADSTRAPSERRAAFVGLSR